MQSLPKGASGSGAAVQSGFALQAAETGRPQARLTRSNVGWGSSVAASTKLQLALPSSISGGATRKRTALDTEIHGDSAGTLNSVSDESAPELQTASRYRDRKSVVEGKRAGDVMSKAQE